MDLHKFGLLISTLLEGMAIQAEIAAMHAANQSAEWLGEKLPFCESDFRDKADHAWACAQQARMQVR